MSKGAIIPKSLVFNRKRYYYSSSHGTQKEANARARVIRDNGNYARVQKHTYPWGRESMIVYVRQA